MRRSLVRREMDARRYDRAAGANAFSLSVRYAHRLNRAVQKVTGGRYANGVAVLCPAPLPSEQARIHNDTDERPAPRQDQLGENGGLCAQGRSPRRCCRRTGGASWSPDSSEVIGDVLHGRAASYRDGRLCRMGHRRARSAVAHSARDLSRSASSRERAAAGSTLPSWMTERE